MNQNRFFDEQFITLIKSEIMDGHKTENGELKTKSWKISNADNEISEDISQIAIHCEGELEYSCCSSVTIDSTRIKTLEQEQENLTASLIALTSHFAHVQFRLRQIVDAPPCDRELLIKNLEDFASRGIPEANNNIELSEYGDLVSNLDQAYRQQFDLIERLKDHLISLESKSGYRTCFPKQCNLPNGRFLLAYNKTQNVKFSSPLQIREKRITTMKNQISNLEELFALFQCGSEETQLQNKELEADLNEIEHFHEEKLNQKSNKLELNSNSNEKLLRSKAPTATSLLQRLNKMAHMSMSSLGLYANILARKFGVSKWNYLQKELKESVQEIISLAMTLKLDILNNSRLADSDGVSLLVAKSFCLTNVQLFSLIRRKFAPALQKLIHHGIHRKFHATVTTSPTQKYFEDDLYVCNSDKNTIKESNTTEQLHVWELILEYCTIIDTEEYIESPKIIESKISLLNAIGYIRAVHAPYKRNFNSYFKSFVIAGLNSHQLVRWLELIFQCKSLIQAHYTSWSYVVRTGFRDALSLIDQLMIYDFDIPVNIVIR